jgi:pullulanase/glycogen debranching enzyme
MEDNLSWNCSAEGPTDDPKVIELRERQKRNFIAILFISLWVAMLLAGDESGRSQQGNNNAYCQDKGDLSAVYYAYVCADVANLRLGTHNNFK